MAGPKNKFWGSISLDNLGKAVKSLPEKMKEDEKYGRQFYIEAAQWDDDGISLSVWNKETNETTKIGSLRVSKFQDKPKSESLESSNDDLPF